MWSNFLAIKNYIVQYKLQYGKHNREYNDIKELKNPILRCLVFNYLIL